MESVKIVLLTGGSSGIGAATARVLAEAGMTVYAASRRGTVETPAPGIIPASLDVNDASQTEALVKRIVETEGRIDAVVCNAGNGIYGPVEGTTDAEARYQFETCYFGSLKTIQACLPVFRKQGFGRIITITSVMAILQLPFQGFYSSAKAALLALSESLSMELKGSGIECCSILPGDVRTGFTAARRFNAAAQDPDSPYKARMEKNLRKIEKDERDGMAPEVIAKAIRRQLERRHMAVRIIPRLDYGAVGFLVRILPERPKLRLLNRIYA
ncbi:MAG: SDR family oxidoreductase [Bacteroidales bacterium]|nr:SDR family oxidoreductase [Bacteroidales bacterium]